VFQWKSSPVAAGVILLLSSTGYADPIIIDTFDDGAFSIQANQSTTTATDSQSGLTGVIGGRRDVLLSWNSGNGGGNISACVVTTGSGTFRHSNDADDPTGLDGKVLVEYGLGGDLTADFSADAGITFKIIFADLLHTDGLTLTLDTEGTSASVAKDIPATPGGVNYVSFLFSEFAGISSNNIDYIAFEIDGPRGADVTIDRIKHDPGGGDIPEPASLTLLAVGLGAAALAGRRRRGRRRR